MAKPCVLIVQSILKYETVLAIQFDGAYVLIPVHFVASLINDGKNIVTNSMSPRAKVRQSEADWDYENDNTTKLSI